MIEGVSKEQERAVLSKAMRTVILAGAGSGKTRTVAKRITHLVEDCDIPESSIVAVSFTRRSGHELQERLGGLRGVVCGTLHSIALDICCRFDGNLRVINEFESLSLVAECGKQLGFCTSEGQWRVSSAINWLKAIERMRVTGESSLRNDDKMTEIYLSKLKAGGDADYLELLVRARKHLKEGAMSHIRHLFVDEAQDIDGLQWDVIRDFVRYGNKCKITVVGDLAQNIYSWRGAQPEVLRDFPGELYTLRDCYRCPPMVVRFANKLISKNPEGQEPMIPIKMGGSYPFIGAEDVLSSVRRYLDINYSYRDIAVLCRTNKKVNEYITRLKDNGIPTFRPRSKTVNSPLAAIMAFGKRPTSAAAYSRMAEAIKEQLNLTAPPHTDHTVLFMISSQDEAMRAVGLAIDKCSPTYAMVSDVISELNTVMYAECKEWHGRAGKTVTFALNDLTLSEEEPENQVSVMTMHQAKGLEWPVVIIPDVDYGVFPSYAAMKSVSQMEDERRLCYVAITRSTDKLAILHSGDDSRHMSPFISEMMVPKPPPEYNVVIPFAS